MTPESAVQRVESPCIKVCVLDAWDVCVGCGRTRTEIAMWTSSSAEEQLGIRARAEERLASRAQHRRQDVQRDDT